MCHCYREQDALLETLFLVAFFFILVVFLGTEPVHAADVSVGVNLGLWYPFGQPAHPTQTIFSEDAAYSSWSLPLHIGPHVDVYSQTTYYSFGLLYDRHAYNRNYGGRACIFDLPCEAYHVEERLLIGGYRGRLAIGRESPITKLTIHLGSDFGLEDHQLWTRRNHTETFKPKQNDKLIAVLSPFIRATYQSKIRPFVDLGLLHRFSDSEAKLTQAGVLSNQIFIRAGLEFSIAAEQLIDTLTPTSTQ